MISGKSHDPVLPITGEELIALIPQKPPFVLISSLVSVTETGCVTTFRVSDGHVLNDNGCLNVSGLVENMAQTCAAKVGYEYNRIGKKLPIGFIGDLRDFVYTALPKIGEEIVTEIKIENKVFDVTIISGKIMLNGNEIASGKMKIFVDPSSS